jgi:hypothetical protein
MPSRRGPHSVNISVQLLLVINTFIPERELWGCVKGAQLEVGYLTRDLGVPDKTVFSFSQAQVRADRENIVNALYGRNALVEHNDNLLFIFQGHGLSYENELGRLPTEALAPCDHGGPSVVPDISDRELNIIVSEISRKKGPNSHRHLE